MAHAISPASAPIGSQLPAATVTAATSSEKRQALNTRGMLTTVLMTTMTMASVKGKL